MFKESDMIYRNLGNSGLKVSVLSMGMFTICDIPYQQNLNIIKKCLQSGINYFDTSESYSNGQTNKMLGRIFKQIGQARQNYIISTKIWNSPDPSVNTRRTTNRKHIKKNIKDCLESLQTDYIDVVFAHAYDEFTPMEQICRSFHQIIEQGYCFYWGTSNWEAQIVFQALQVCQQFNLHKPIVAQNQYNMVNRKHIQNNYQRLFRVYNYGLIGYSPLLGGILTGKYLQNQNIEDSRFIKQKTGGYSKTHLKQFFYYGIDEKQFNESLIKIKKIAEEQMNCKLLQLAIAWVIKYQYTCSALGGAKSIKQLQSILKWRDAYQKLTPQLQTRINTILNTNPPQKIAKLPYVRPIYIKKQ